MPAKESFDTHEWAALRNAPHLVVLATAQSGASGIFGTIGEMMTAGKAVFEATHNPHDLIRELAAKEEVKAAQEALRADLEQAEPQDIRAWVRENSLAKVKQALTILNMRSPEHTAAYGAWLRDLAKRVAEASKEGGFLGFGGERVSAGERDYLAALEATLT